MSKTTNIMLVGVGGQGVLLASELISRAALHSGFDVKKSEVHGMAQRGGSVVSNVRFGDKVFSPIIARGEADILLAFEKMEALRWVNYLKPSGLIITSTQRIDPLTVAMGKAVYPDNILNRLQATDHQVVSIDALELAREAGSQKAINTVMLGTLVNYLELDLESVREIVKESVPPRTIDINLKAFASGLEKGK